MQRCDRIVKQAVAQFRPLALPEAAACLRYTSNPSPFRFFRIVVVIISLIIVLSFVFVVVVLVIIMGVLVGRLVTIIGRISVDSIVCRFAPLVFSV